MLTFPQRKALAGLMRGLRPLAARELGVRSDVMWRLEERGLARRVIHDQWISTDAGEAAYEAAMEELARRAGL